MDLATKDQQSELILVRASDGMQMNLRALQGLWTEEQYLALSDSSRQLIEFSDGMIEVLTLPTDRHQVMLAFIYSLLVNHIHPLGGKVLFAPLRVRIREGKQREPDIVVLLDARDPRRQDRFWLGADLVVEIVSPDDPMRDLVMKRFDYAEAGFPEYWIINPEDETISVLQLVDDQYVEYGIFGRGQQLRSVLLPHFSMAATAVFDAE